MAADGPQSAVERALALYSQFLAPGDLCFDIGANVGQRTALFVELGARIVAVEPQPQCVDELTRRFEGDDRVIVVPKAAARRRGRAKLVLSDASTISSMSPEWIERVQASGRFEGFTWNKTIKVKTTTLDDLIREYGLPRFCKIDVEGYELDVLAGLSRTVGALSFEYTPEHDATGRLIVRRLVELGFDEFNFSVRESLVMVSDEWFSAGEILQYLSSTPSDGIFFGDVYARS